MLPAYSGSFAGKICSGKVLTDPDDVREINLLLVRIEFYVIRMQEMDPRVQIEIVDRFWILPVDKAVYPVGAANVQDRNVLAVSYAAPIVKIAIERSNGQMVLPGPSCVELLVAVLKVFPFPPCAVTEQRSGQHNGDVTDDLKCSLASAAH